MFCKAGIVSGTESKGSVRRFLGEASRRSNRPSPCLRGGGKAPIYSEKGKRIGHFCHKVERRIRPARKKKANKRCCKIAIDTCFLKEAEESKTKGAGRYTIERRVGEIRINPSKTRHRACRRRYCADVLPDQGKENDVAVRGGLKDGRDMRGRAFPPE